MPNYRGEPAFVQMTLAHVFGISACVQYYYVTNNPLSLTDPSGYFFSWLKKAFKKVLKIVKKIIKKVVKVIKRVIKAIEKIITKVIMALPVEIRIVAAIAVAVYAPQYLGHFVRASFATIGVTSAAAISAGTAFATGALAGLISTGSFKGALSAGLTAVAFAGIGAHFGKLASANNFANAGAAARGVAPVVKTLANGLTRAQFALKSLAHGVVGGLSSKLSGGSFSKSFLSTGFVQAFAPGIDGIGVDAGAIGVSQRVGAAALLGGIASKIVGGSFSSGARLGAFSRWFNDEVHNQLAQKRANAIKADIEARGGFSGKGEADMLYQLNSDPGMEVTVVASQLTATSDGNWGACPNGHTGSCSTGYITGDDYAVHGQGRIRHRPDGTYGFYDQQYNYELHFDFSLRGIFRNIGTIFGSPPGGWYNTSYWIHYDGDINITNPQ